MAERKSSRKQTSARILALVLAGVLVFSALLTVILK